MPSLQQQLASDNSQLNLNNPPPGEGTDPDLEAAADNQAPGAQKDPSELVAAGPKAFISKTEDQSLEQLNNRLRNSVGKTTKQNEMIDAWLDLMDKARDEDHYDKKYWAFLNGYLALKMAQLLENELSIIETSVKMYIHKLKSKHPNASLEERMSVGKFLDEMKDEPDILVGFTVFLAEEFLAQNKSPDNDKIVEEGANADWNSSSTLQNNIEKMKKDFANAERGSFDIEAFQKASQELIGNLLIERQVDIM